jgi:hypothetical protein
MKSILFIKHLKMDLIEGSETSAKPNLKPGENPKENTQNSEGPKKVPDDGRLLSKHVEANI